MASNIQIRNVPEDVHRKLKVRAAQFGVSLSDLLLEQIIGFARRPTPEEVHARIEAAGSVDTDTESADLIRELRGPLRSSG